MTPQQLTTLVTALRASTNPTVVAALAIRDDTGLAAWCNADASPAVKAWRQVTPAMVATAIDASELDGLTQGKRDTIAMLLEFFGGFDATKAGGLKAITDCFPNAGASVSRGAMLLVAQENASNAEVLIGQNTSGGLVDMASQGAGTLTAKVRVAFTGDVGVNELSHALNTQ